MNRIALAVLFTVAAFSRTASAQDLEGNERTLVVVPFTAGGVSDDEASRLTAAAVNAATRAGYRAEEARVSMNDLLAINGCESSDDACLANIPSTLGVDVLILGRVRVESGAASLVLVVIEPGKDRIRRQIALEGASSIERATRSEESIAVMLGATPTPDETIGGAGGETAGNGLDLSPRPAIKGGFNTSRVSRRSWIIGAAGLGSVVAGGVMLAIGNNRQTAIDDAATSTGDDLDDLEGLEGQARFFFGVGNVLVVGGLIATAVGAALVFHESRPRAEAPPTVSVSPVVVRGGAGVVIRVVGWQ